MRSICLFVLLAIVAVAFAQQQHCIEKDFTAQVVMVEPAKHWDDQHTIYFSSDTQKQRVDINEFDPEIKSFSIYHRFDLGKMYIYDKATQKCEVHQIHGELKPYCLANNATHEGQVTIGGQLKADVWKEKIYGFELRLVLSSFQGIPINIFSKGGTRHSVIMQEWYNYQHGVQSDKIFDVPASCNQAQPARLMASAKKSDIPVQRLVERVNSLMMGYTAH
jgi:hypothetical protein